ncbi:MAG: hypothetical protein JJ897_10795, partial [Marinibacterium sp.]|nr:hypothetical protein [Marinibacterium sp.]
VDMQAHVHHQYFLGLQLMVAVEEGKKVVGDWMFRLFRQQHLDKFLSSFEKLGLTDLPHAVAAHAITPFPTELAAYKWNTWKSPTKRRGSVSDIHGGCMLAQPFAGFRGKPALVFSTAGMRITVFL